MSKATEGKQNKLNKWLTDWVISKSENNLNKWLTNWVKFSKRKNTKGK